MKEWTRRLPNKNGRWWAAVKYGDEKGYLVKLMHVFGYKVEGELTPSVHVTPFWGGAIPLSAARKFDILWAEEPIPVPTPPKYRPVKKLKAIDED